MHDKVETFRARGDDGTDYVVVRIRPYKRSDTLDGVGGYLNYCEPRLSSGESVVPGRVPGTFRVLRTGVLLTVESPTAWPSWIASKERVVDIRDARGARESGRMRAAGF
jgi:hypothetical protein